MRNTLLLALTLFTAGGGTTFGQTCTFSVAGLNDWRKVMGPVNVECGGFLQRSAPWGNWGVNSNFGTRNDTTQFQG